MKNIFKNKNILVTSGVGSIGSVIVSELLEKHSPKQVRIFDNNEEKIFEASQKFNNYKNARFLIGDIRDRERVSWAVKDINYVFHTAALKHVALNEYNPFEAIKTNILGTENILMSAIKGKVLKFINVSSDKASMPSSTMGASKLLAERITTAINYYKGKSPTVCASVRFGNVMGSSGSVIPIFIKQIKNGGPVTITDKKMTRYFMTTKQAVNLIFEATKIAIGGEVFILKMPLLKIMDLAKVLINSISVKPRIIKIKIIGKRPGEKIHEKILTVFEKQYCLEMKQMYLIPPMLENPNLNKKDIKKNIFYYHKAGARKSKFLSNDKNQYLKINQIKNLLKQAELI